MTQRNEPTVSNGFNLFSKKEAKSPSALADDALKAFTDAQAKLDEAQKAIEAQIVDHKAEIAARQAKLADADEQSSRLSRIKNRFAELMA